MPKKVKRDWKTYNNQLVKRGELLLDLDFVENWEEELEEMNRGKRGKPYEYQKSLIEFLTFPRYFFRLPFRQDEGFVEALGKFVPERASDRANVKLALADPAYDSREKFNLLETLGIEPGIKIKRRASDKARGSGARRRGAKEFLKDERSENERLAMEEGGRLRVRSLNLKLTFGEFVTAHKFKNMAKEMMLKAFCYNLVVNLSANI